MINHVTSKDWSEAGKLPGFANLIETEIERGKRHDTILIVAICKDRNSKESKKIIRREKLSGKYCLSAKEIWEVDKKYTIERGKWEGSVLEERQGIYYIDNRATFVAVITEGTLVSSEKTDSHGNQIKHVTGGKVIEKILNWGDMFNVFDMADDGWNTGNWGTGNQLFKVLFSLEVK